MKGTFTFTDGASNQTNLTKSSELEAKESRFLFAKNLFRKVKQLFVQEEISETIFSLGNWKKLKVILPYFLSSTKQSCCNFNLV